jgi:predicted nucleic acid-binding protein
MQLYILDSSAILCFLLGEDGAGDVSELLQKAGSGNGTKILLPFIALMELEYWLLRRLPPEEVTGVLLRLETWAVEIEESYPEWRHQAASIKADATLSVADAWIAALAIIHNAFLVHKDPEFNKVPRLRVLELPYKTKRG